MNKKEIILYDINSIPDGIELYKIIDTYKKEKVIVYDGSKSNKPKVITLEEDTKIINTDKTDV